MGVAVALALGFSGSMSCGVSPIDVPGALIAGPSPIPVYHPGDTATVTVTQGARPIVWELECDCISFEVATDSMSALVTAVEAGSGRLKLSNQFGWLSLRVEVTDP
jgi:hypothetical protein